MINKGRTIARFLSPEFFGLNILHPYFTRNTNLSKDKIIENYGHLWKIEKAFSISKHNLKVRPIYHRLQKRIEAHITINFVAYKVYKELERQLKEKKANIYPPTFWIDPF